MFYRIVAALLEYPDAWLRAALPEIAQAVHDDRSSMSVEERAALTVFVGRLMVGEPLTLEESYARTFDLTPENSLHLTHHLIGEDRNRGPALVDLGEFYKLHGLAISRNELPDYLPLMLEFVSTLDAAAGLRFLSRWNKVLRQLAANLGEDENGYGALIRLVEGRGRSAADEDDAEPVAARPRTDPCLDDADFEPPVTWTTPTAGSACPSNR